MNNQFKVARTVASWTTRSFLVGSIVVLLSVIANAQSATDGSTPTGMSPGASAGSYALTGFENVNLFNGHLNFHLPLLQVGGRGSAGYTINLDLERQWRTRKTPPNVIYPETGPWGGLEVGYSPGVLLGRVVGAPTGGSCEENQGWRDSLTRLTFIGADGTEYELIDKLTMGVPQESSYNVDCSIGYNFNRGKVFVTHDGSAVTFISDVDIKDAYGFFIDEIRPSGYLLLKDGTRYRIDGGLVTSIQDRNGNKVTVAGVGRTVTDSLNRVVTVAYSYDSNPALDYDQISFKGTAGGARTIRIWKSYLSNVLRSGFSIQTWQQLFPEMNGSTSNQFNPLVVSSVELPDGRRYWFKYNPYGELARVELPTGGAIEYDYAAGLRSGVASGSYGGGGAYTTKQIYRRVVQRRIYKDSSSVYESKMTISRPENSVTETDGYVLVEQRSYAGTLMASDKHYFYGTAVVPNYQTPLDYSFWKDGRELKTESLSLTGSVLRSVEHTWANSAGNPQITQSVTTLSDTNQVAKQTFLYDQYNNKTDVYEYDYGTGAAGALVRRTHTDFLTTNSVNSIAYDTVNPNTSSPDPAATVHLRSLPTQTQVFDAGGTEKSRATFEYDYYVASSPRALLFPRPGISGLASTTDYKPRGNVTRATNWILSTSTQIHSYPQYDIAGNVVRTTDPLGNVTEFFFEDRFGTPDGEAEANSAPSELAGGLTSFAFVTTVKNAANHYSYTQYDYHLGRAVDSEDPNGVVSSGYSQNDALDRPTKVIRAVGTSVQNQTVFAYDDVARKITTTSDLNSSGDGALVSMMCYDGLGRTIETRQYEGGTNYIATQQEYDALGRAYKTSNPFRPWQMESPVWTISGFDALGRVTTVTTPDSAVVNTSYSGNTVTVTDQAGKARKSVTDALGRLKEIYEDPSGLNYLTSYTYDALDNLTTVTQGTQQRFFMYDSLKRPIRARNPEQDVNSNLTLADPLTGNSQWSLGYQYDSNGNLLVKTDARNVSTHFSYDALNRALRRWYNGSSSLTATTHNSPALPSGVGASDEANYIYDSQTLPAGAPSYSRGSATGRLVATTYGSGSSAGDYFAFDVLGRGTLKIQQTGGINYQVQRGYNLANGVTWQTYPAGSVRTVTYTYDSAGRTSSFSGALGDSVSRTYATGITYSVWGGLSREQFGTDLFLYHRQHYTNRGQLFDMRVGTTDDGSWNRGAIINYYSWVNLGFGNTGTDTNGNVYVQQHWIFHDDQMSAWTVHQQNYAYDSLNRISWAGEYLNGVTNTGSQHYLYDRWGNRRIDPATWGTGINNKQFDVTTSNNRLAVPSGQSGTMSYDSAGNLTTDTYTGAGSRIYDAENRMTKAWGGNNQWQEYAYNADAQRVRRKVDAVETWQVYGFDGELLAEYAAGGAATSPQKEYGYRNGQLLVTAEPSAQIKWLVADHLGTPRMIFDKTGSLANVRRHDYLPFGEELFAGVGGRTTQNGYTADTVRQKFTSKERDNETGLDYFLVRYYSSTQGRFTSADSFGGSKLNPQTLNLYSYVQNDPLNFKDPTGHMAQPWWIKEGLRVGEPMGQDPNQKPLPKETEGGPLGKPIQNPCFECPGSYPVDLGTVTIVAEPDPIESPEPTPSTPSDNDNFRRVNFSYPFSPFLSFNLGISKDRYRNIYLSPGINAGLSLPIPGFSWLTGRTFNAAGQQVHSETDVANVLRGPSAGVNISPGFPAFSGFWNTNPTGNRWLDFVGPAIPTGGSTFSGGIGLPEATITREITFGTVYKTKTW